MKLASIFVLFGAFLLASPALAQDRAIPYQVGQTCHYKQIDYLKESDYSRTVVAVNPDGSADLMVKGESVTGREVWSRSGDPLKVILYGSTETIEGSSQLLQSSSLGAEWSYSYSYRFTYNGWTGTSTVAMKAKVIGRGTANVAGRTIEVAQVSYRGRYTDTYPPGTPIRVNTSGWIDEQRTLALTTDFPCFEVASIRDTWKYHSTTPLVRRERRLERIGNSSPG